MKDELNLKPRRRVVVIMKLQADSWEEISHNLQHYRTEIARHGRLPANSVSGGYSSGHIIVSSEDGSITHDSWAKELDEYLEDLKTKEAAHLEGVGE